MSEAYEIRDDQLATAVPDAPGAQAQSRWANRPGERRDKTAAADIEIDSDRATGANGETSAWGQQGAYEVPQVD